MNNELAMEYCKAFVVVLTHYAKAVERADMETFPPVSNVLHRVAPAKQFCPTRNL